MRDSFFLNEEESQRYTLHMHTSDDKTLQMNTRIDTSKTPIDETIRPPR